MGWTEIYFYNVKNKKAVKEYIDTLFTWKNKEKEISVLKSAMVSNIYYAALKINEKGEEYVSAEVVLTHTRQGEYLAYKEISETSFPCETRCPISILKLLSPTDSENANEWRKYCFQNAEKEKEKRKQPSLGKLPIGSVISFQCSFDSKLNDIKKGDKITLKKIIHNGKAIWYGHGYRWKRTLIPDNYEIIN